MGRIQSKGKGKGISSAVTPFKRRTARWVAHTPRSITDLIVTMAKKGLSPSQIGVAIRDREAVPSIKLLTGQKIVRLLKKNGICLLMQVRLPRFLRTSTPWSRRRWTSGVTCRSAERTRMRNTGWFWSNRGSTDWLGTTAAPNVFPTSGNSNWFFIQQR